MVKSLNIGLIGCGRWGSNVLRDLLSLHCQVSVVDTSSSRRQHALDNGAHIAVSGVSDLPKLDGAVVCTPTSLHAQTIRELAHLGVPIFCEKPLTNDLEAAKELAALLDRRLFVMDKWRYHPGIEKMAAIVSSGTYGSAQGLLTVRKQLGNPHPDVDGVWILAPHDVSIGLEIFGRISDVTSSKGFCHRGNLCEVMATLGTAPWHVLHVSTVSPVKERVIKLFCDEAVILLTDAMASELLILSPDDSASNTAEDRIIERVPIGMAMPLLAELRSFTEHLHGGPPPKTAAQEALRTVEVVAQLRALAIRPNKIMQPV